ncbi:MAG: class II aldolase/adducin family protein [Thermoanaerobaculia bacterium]
MPDRFERVRREVLQHSRRMWESGLCVVSEGNVSRRADAEGRYIAITPRSIPYETMKEDEIVIVESSSRKPVDSSRAASDLVAMHLAIYRARNDVGAIMHTHSPFVTTLSILRRPLPPVIEEMIVTFGGTAEVAEYAFTGTNELGANAAAALGDRMAAILSNHGNVCVGRDLEQALHVAVVMESAARVYVQALQIGEPFVLPDSAVREGRKMFEERLKAKSPFK